MIDSRHTPPPESLVFHRVTRATRHPLLLPRLGSTSRLHGLVSLYPSPPYQALARSTAFIWSPFTSATTAPPGSPPRSAARHTSSYNSSVPTTEPETVRPRASDFPTLFRTTHPSPSTCIQPRPIGYLPPSLIGTPDPASIPLPDTSTLLPLASPPNLQVS